MSNSDDFATFTRDSFTTERAHLVCQYCAHIGLELQINANNGGARPVYPECHSVTPLPGVSWLPKVRNPRVSRSSVDTLAVWQENGDHCAFCGKSRELCARLSIGLTAQHIVPFSFEGDAWPLIPFCSRCQQSSAAALAETRCVQDALASLDDVIRRIEEKHPELLA